MKGRCLCGAVEIEVSAPVSEISICHCDPCRKWGGTVFAGFETPVEAVSVTGPVKTYASSSFAERAWCADCGTHLWFRNIGEAYELTPGLFAEARNAPLSREVYADRALASVPLIGDHARVTKAEYEAKNRFVEDEG